MLIKSAPLTRRSFVQAAGGACIVNAIRPSLAHATKAAYPNSSTPRLGVVVWVHPGQSIDEAIRGVHALGLPTCQIGFETLTAEVAKPLQAALKKFGVQATALSEHGPGERIFNFYDGPETIGIVPRATREARIRNLELAADLAAVCGIPAIHSHCGFIPENPHDPLYPETVAAMKKIAAYCKTREISFLCETGEETPITLLRMIEDVGADNVFVNLDLANLILYGKGNPVDAMDVIGHLVRGIHAKDGLFPSDPKTLGTEVAIGKGKVDFPVVFNKLHKVNYQGTITIERETEGTEQREDILRSKLFLEDLIGNTFS